MQTIQIGKIIKSKNNKHSMLKLEEDADTDIKEKREIRKKVAILVGFCYEDSANNTDVERRTLPGIVIDLYQAYKQALLMKADKIVIITDLTEDKRSQIILNALLVKIVETEILSFIKDVKTLDYYNLYKNYDNILDILEETSKDASNVFFYYTGHASQGYLKLPKMTKLFTSLVGADDYDEKHQISMILIRNLFLHKSIVGSDIFIIFDCCNGSGVNLPYTYEGNTYKLVCPLEINKKKYSHFEDILDDIKKTSGGDKLTEREGLSGGGRLSGREGLGGRERLSGREGLSGGDRLLRREGLGGGDRLSGREGLSGGGRLSEREGLSGRRDNMKEVNIGGDGLEFFYNRIISVSASRSHEVSITTKDGSLFSLEFFKLLQEKNLELGKIINIINEKISNQLKEKQNSRILLGQKKIHFQNAMIYSSHPGIIYPWDWLQEGIYSSIDIDHKNKIIKFRRPGNVVESSNSADEE